MKKFYEILIIFIVFFTIFFLVNKSIKIEKKLLFTEVVNNIKNLKDYKKIILENKTLNNDLISYKNKLLKNIELEEEIKELKKLLDLKKVYTDYKMVYSTVLSLDKMYFQNTFSIDKGKNDLVSVNDAVISSNGLIGIVERVYDDNSIIKLLTSTSNNISVKIKTEKDFVYGSLEEYQDGYYLVKGTTSYDNVGLNDKVYTTGISNLPSGIYIGEVKDIKKDNYEISNILYVTNNQDITSIRYVAVLGNNK